MDRKGLNRNAIAAALAFVMAGAVVAQAGTPATPNAVVVEGHSNDREAAGNIIDSRVLASIEDATAAALIGALETRFAGRKVALRMGDVESERASLRDIALKGTGQIRLGQDAAWMPIRFEALYDTDTRAVLSPAIVLEGTSVAAAPRLPLPVLQAQVRAAMGDEFASQQVDVSLRQAQVIGNDGRRLVVRAQGVARFDGSETAPVTVRALYEQGSGRWLDAQYDFDVVGS